MDPASFSPHAMARAAGLHASTAAVPDSRLRRTVAAVATSVAALAMAGTAGAVGLGSARGQLLIGRPLQITLPVTQDSTAEPPSECVSADVFYGDVRLPPASVEAQLQPTRTGQTVRVVARTAIDEPVVSVDVHLGCRDRLTRRIVLLAEPADPRADDTAPATIALPPRIPAQAQAPAQAPTRPAAAVPAQPQLRLATAVSNDGGPAPSSSRRRAQHPPRQPAAHPARGGRLQLAPLDLQDLGEPRLRVSDTLGMAPQASPERRAQALAAWRALTLQADDLLRQDQRLTDLERRQQTAARQQQAQLAAFDRRLTEAQAQRYANPLVAALAVAAAAALALALSLWLRVRRLQRDATPWWAPHDDGALPAPARASAPAPAARQAPAQQPPLPTGEATVCIVPVTAPVPEPPPPIPDLPPSAGLDLDVELDRGLDFDLDSLAMPLPLHASRLEASAAGTAGQPSTLTAATEDLRDVKQTVDLFACVGEFDQAIASLRGHLERHGGASPGGWLELLHLLVMLGRREDFEIARAQFTQRFNASVPPYARWSSSEPGLEDHGATLARICALWPSARVLEAIERAIAAGPGVVHEATFSIDAFEELLMLHQVCHHLLARDGIDGSADASAPGIAGLDLVL